MKQIALILTFLLTSIGGHIFAQDKLVFNDEKVVECKVLEITPEVIKYTKHSMPDGPVYTVYKTEVNSIVFENGEIELIKPSSITNTYQSGKEKRRDKAADWPVYRSTWGLDILSPAFGEIETWFEIRNEKNMIGHTISLIGFWNRSGYYYDDFACADGYDCFDSYYGYGGGLSVAYAPKFYFIDHPIARPFAGPEVAMGMITNYDPAGYFHGMARVGVALTPKPKLNITIDVAGGGYVTFDGYSNWGGGLLNLGLSFGVNYRDGQRKTNKE